VQRIFFVKHARYLLHTRDEALAARVQRTLAGG
jgi:hypothetical protein